MSDAEGEQRPPALDEFVAELKRLRQQAGNPSFRKMAELSGAVSHATLHLTVTGRRLQPWETVREFVRACGGDEAEWCSRYRRTKAVLSGELPDPADNTEDGGTAGEDSAVQTGAATAEHATAEHAGVGASADGRGPDGSNVPSPVRTGSSRRRRLAVPLAVLVVAAVVVGLVVVGLRVLGGDDGRAEAGDKQATGGAASGPPEPAALTEPVHEGDASTLSRDLGIQDGAVVAPEQRFTRTFELHNVGTVHWKGRYLQRMDHETGPRHCTAPDRVRIADTAPGEKVKVPVTATAAGEPTTCKVHWKMVDHTGRQLLPEYRPAYFLVHVRAGSSGPSD